MPGAPRPRPIHGGFTHAQMLHLLRRACSIAGLDPEGAVLLRGQTNAVLRLAHHPVVVKIARNGTDPAEVHRTVTLVRWLMDLGFPTVPLHQPDLQPLVVDGHAITLWDHLPQPDRPPPAEALARPLHTLHNLPAPPIPLPSLDPCAAIRSSLATTSILNAATLAFLHEQVDHLEHALTGITYERAPAIVQGDPQHRNALHAADGAVLCDWDSVALGQPEWDLVTIEIHCRRFGHGEAHHRRFAKAYGRDITTWPGYPTLRDLRELRMITTNARKASHEPEKIREVLTRIDALRDRALDARWRIL
ncbi:phosphotransferase family protein [Streptomyces sp. 4N509B]|uniref:phosphotransferase family protein n=1 Tax=Streptomyces sp. 4N509B TaxID=3457413 RepID=UPI003FD28BE3